jgi:lipopolysaccharide transport system permease protein
VPEAVALIELSNEDRLTPGGPESSDYLDAMRLILQQDEPSDSDIVMGETQTDREPVFEIRPSHGWVSLHLQDLWTSRELLYFLTWRDVKVRYKQTALGAAWAMLQPFLLMVVFSIFFGRLLSVPSGGVPYPVFAYTALVPWQMFANAVAQSGGSLVANQQLLTKVYFPRLLIPVSATLGNLVDFVFAFAILIGMMVYYGIHPTAAILVTPFLALLAAVTALGVGLWLSALNVRYRDVRYVIPFMVQLWLFATPVAYPSTIVPNQWRWVYHLNPMAGVVEGFRWALLGTGHLDPMFSVSVVVAIVGLVGGAVYFRRTERTFADVI